MISNLLKKESIRMLDRVESWQSAIKEAVKPLVDSNYCKESYIDGIIENTKKMGPYYIIADNVALIHGRPEQGVLKQQLAITLLKEPVPFKDDGKHDARLLIVLAAEDSNSHLQVMQDLAEILSDDKYIENILNATSVDQIYDLFCKK